MCMMWFKFDFGSNIFNPLCFYFFFLKLIHYHNLEWSALRAESLRSFQDNPTYKCISARSVWTKQNEKPNWFERFLTENNLKPPNVHSWSWISAFNLASLSLPLTYICKSRDVNCTNVHRIHLHNFCKPAKNNATQRIYMYSVIPTRAGWQIWSLRECINTVCITNTVYNGNFAFSNLYVEVQN